MNTRKLMTILFIIYLGCVVLQHFQEHGLTEVKSNWEAIKSFTDNLLN